MPYLVALLAGACVMLLLTALYELSATPARAVSREIEQLRSTQPSPFGAISRRAPEKPYSRQTSQAETAIRP